MFLVRPETTLLTNNSSKKPLYLNKLLIFDSLKNKLSIIPIKWPLKDYQNQKK